MRTHVISGICAGCLGLAVPFCQAQLKLRPPDSAQQITILPSDLAVFEAARDRNDLSCTVVQHKPDLGFDLHFHAGYDVTIPMNELAGDGNLLTVVFRVYPANDKSKSAFFVQHFTVPSIDEDAKGSADLQGVVDLGEGTYHVDWLMRDRAERLCSSSWDMDATLNGKDRPMPLFLKPAEVAQTREHPFVNDPVERPELSPSEQLNLKILVNFAPQWEGSAAMQRVDQDALVTILKALERDPHVGRISLVAFNISQTRVFYRQQPSAEIDYPALGRALQSVQLGTVGLQNLGKYTETDFLEQLIESEVAESSHPDAVIFAGPKAMLQADVPQSDLRRIGNVECPVFYLNYNPDPQAVPWKDSISHAIRVFRGIEYTITRPRDVWVSTSDVLTKIIHAKRTRTVASVAPGGGGAGTAQTFH